MAGAGYKLFNTGDVLLASEVNTYLMQQTVMVFANSTARTTALSGVLAEGMVSYLQDTNVVEIYNGSAWASLDDPNAIQNSIVDAKGDLISATADNTPARLASSGVNGDVLTVDTSTATGLKWAAAAGGGKVLQVVHADTTTDTTVASTTPTDTTLSATITPSSATSKVLVIVAQNAGVQSQSQNSYSRMRLMRGATEIWASGTEMLTSDGDTTGGGSNNVVTQQSIVYLDSPSTTSATTYKTQGYVNSTANSNAFRAQRTSSRSNIILMEIGA